MSVPFYIEMFLRISSAGETFTLDYKHFSVIYPSYIDANKTLKKGRRISVEDAVPNPTVIDIGQALQVTCSDCCAPAFVYGPIGFILLFLSQH